MPRHAEDISKIEDIGQRLDALLDALETSSSEVARVGSDLDKPLEELLAEEPAPKVKPERSPPPSPEPEPEAEAETAVDAQVPEAGAVEEPQAEPETEPLIEDATPQAPAEAGPEPAVEAEPEPASEAHTEPVPEEVGGDDDSEIDDGLLIEPESYATTSAADDIDGAPVGPLNLEEELDEELESLLASGEFEDPLAEMGVDESAEPLELPEDSPPPVAAAPEPIEDRKPNLPTDEAELIGELDEQLAALADAQLAEDEPPEPEKASEPVEAPKAEPAPAPAAGPDAKPEPAQEPAAQPEIVTKPVAPAPKPKQGWKLHAQRAWTVARPVAERAMVRAGMLAVAGATRASAPLKDKPQAKQIVGWVGLVQGFLAGCVWAYLVLWHNPPAPPAETPQPTLVAPAEG